MEEYMDELKKRSIGELLRDIRESKLLSVQAVSMRLKIDKRQIQALEEEDYDIFPAHVYARGVFERYANLLDLDLSEALRLFEYSWQTHTVQAKIPDSKTTAPPNTRGWPINMRLPSSLSIFAITGVVGVLCIGLAVFFIVRQMPSFSFDEPANGTLTHERSIIVKGRGDTRIELTLNKQPVYIGTNSQFQHPVLLQKGVNELVLQGKTSLGKVSDITHYIVVE